MGQEEPARPDPKTRPARSLPAGTAAAAFPPHQLPPFPGSCPPPSPRSTPRTAIPSRLPASAPQPGGAAPTVAAATAAAARLSAAGRGRVGQGRRQATPPVATPRSGHASSRAGTRPLTAGPAL